MANIGFISLGCAKNQVDCERMMYRVQEAGHTVCPGVAGCDVVVINTCGFIDSAKTEAIDFILQMGQLKSEVLGMSEGPKWCQHTFQPSSVVVVLFDKNDVP